MPRIADAWPGCRTLSYPAGCDLQTFCSGFRCQRSRQILLFGLLSCAVCCPLAWHPGDAGFLDESEPVCFLEKAMYCWGYFSFKCVIEFSRKVTQAQRLRDWQFLITNSLRGYSDDLIHLGCDS